MVELNRNEHVIFRRKIVKKVGNLPELLKPMRMKVTCTGLWSRFVA